MGKEFQENVRSSVVSMEVCLHQAEESEVYKEKAEVQIKASRRGNAYNAELRNKKEAAYVSTEKNVWHQHENMRIIEEIENEQVVVMKTTVGDIESELWVKETPKTCRNFIQLCMDGYWDDTIFHRIIKGFITHGGDPTDIGEGGKIYGEPFKVTGETIYNMLKLEKAPVDENDRLLYPPRLLKSIILNKPFSVIISRTIVQKSEEVKDSLKTKIAVVNAMKERIKNKLVDAKKKPKIVENYEIGYAEDDKDIMENE
ncbi:Peptidyl-prolyl cis-trans isomerase CWC27 like protein [Eufriesea mexicana]|uniref:Peptidyl-prolyl cis-trans isomerase n=1 Tax=Eufriesea mexicana TaxID=516756 RepID=A0A310STK1_9HYME|nr:Peptidyl-prolyl cis-trans isomerase CWC27 like protein [Eufriesea mexicana]